MRVLCAANYVAILAYCSLHVRRWDHVLLAEAFYDGYERLRIDFWSVLAFLCASSSMQK